MIKSSIIQYLDNHPPAKCLFDKLLSIGEVYLIGGVLREYRDHKAIKNLRDIDIVVDVKQNKAWDDIICEYFSKANRFGGNKLRCDDLLMDVWSIDQTWAYRNECVHCNRNQYFEYLPETVFLNIDGIIFDWKNEVWNDAKYKAAMESKILDVVLPQNPQLCLNILRAFILQKRYEMTLSDRLKQIICCEAQKYDSISHFADLLMEEQGHRYQRIILDHSEVEKMIASQVL